MSPVFGSVRLPLVPVRERRMLKGIAFPAWVKLRHLLVTGPPGSGKSTMINRLGGWPEEGYIDLTLQGWWKARSLFMRPRETHLGLPFAGQREALALFEPAWLAAWETLELQLERVRYPPQRAHLWSVNWRGRFAFEFLLPAAEEILRRRSTRAGRGTHPVDAEIHEGQIRRQLALFALTAQDFHRQGMRVYLRREGNGGSLWRFTDAGAGEGRASRDE